MGVGGTTWSPHAVVGPIARYAHSMAYDSARHVTVLQGGVGQGANGLNVSGETWEWNGATWTQRIVGTPGTTYYSAMAYDSVRGVTVLFGGMGTNGNRTWEWNGTSWTQRSVAGPASRFSHAMAYDPVRGVTVLFGGKLRTSDALSAETWEWNGTGWTQRKISGPPARYMHSMDFDASRNRIVMYGGSTDSANLQDTWDWDGSTWTLRASLGPSPRANAAMVYNSVRNTSILFGGNIFDDIQSTGRGDTWEFNGTSWSPLVDAPVARTGHAMVYDSSRAQTILFGGSPASASTASLLSNETWEWNGSNWNLREATPPSPREFFSLAYDSARAETILFGGSTGGLIRNGETWVYDENSWTQRLVAGPSPRKSSAMAFDSIRNVAVLFGGDSGTGVNAVYSDETWEWDGATWNQRLVAGPTGRRSHAMAFDPTRGVTVLYGGVPLPNSAQTWEWNGIAWTQRIVQNPPARSYPQMAFNSERGTILLFGGGDSEPVDGFVWEWNGTAWSQLATTGPGLRIQHAMAFDSARNELVMFGGLYRSQNIKNGETWTFSAPCPSDFNHDNTTDFFDYLDFVSAFSQSLPAADFNQDSIVDFFDYLDFVQAFSSGC